MKPTRDEQAFADLLAGLRRDAPGEFAGMARLAQALEHVRPSPTPAPHFRNNLRNRLIAEAAVRRSWLDRVSESWAERNLRLRRSFKFVFANAVAAVVLLAGGTIFAVADTAVPGDWNYWAKRAREDARLLITRAPEPRAYLQMALAREKLAEVQTLLKRGERDADPYLSALNQMDARTLDATELLIGLYGRTQEAAPLTRLTRFANAQRSALEVLLDRLPPGARPPARDSIAILQRISDRVTGIMGGCLCPANPLLPGASKPGSDAGGGGEDTQEPLCPCARFRGEDTTGNNGGQNPPPNDPNDPPVVPPPPGAPDDPDIVDGLIDTVNELDKSVTDTVNNLIDDALEGTPLLDDIVPPSPVPTVSIPPLGLLP